MPKVLLLTTNDIMGGMQRVVINLARELTRRGWSVQNVFPGTPTCEAALEWCRSQGVEVEAGPPALQHMRAPRSNRDLAGLWRFIRESRADVVNLHYGDNMLSLKDVLIVRLAGRARCVTTTHMARAWNLADDDKYKRITRQAARLCHAVVGVSNATRGRLREAGVPDRKIHVIPGGLHPPERLPTRSEARTRIGLPADAFVITTVARLIPAKGLGELIEAAARVPDPARNLRLLIAGDGPERAALQQLADARLKERARLLGHQQDVSDLYAAADIFALPTHEESFGMVFIEAAMHGLPSIGTRVGGVPEAILDGQTGLLVPAQDPAALAGALQCLRDDDRLRQRLGEAARARVHAEFTEAVMADRYERLFRGEARPAPGNTH